MAAKIVVHGRKIGSCPEAGNPVTGTEGERGFTLIEMLIVILVLSVAILGMESVQLYAISQIQRGDDVATAAAIALDVVENFRTMDPETITTVAEGSSEELIVDDAAYTMYTSDGPGAGTNRGGSTYRVSWTVRTDLIGARIVDVQVLWMLAGGVEKRYTTTTIIN